MCIISTWGKFTLVTLVKRPRESLEGQTGMINMVTPTRSAMMRFAQEMEGALMTKVDPKDCVPLIVDREEYRDGVDKMKRIFRVLIGDDTFSGGTNISAGVGGALVVPMTECYRPHLVKAFRLMGYNEDESNRRLTLGKIQYGIVEGNFRFWAIVELMEEKPHV